MDPFTHLPVFQLVVCKECKYACLSQQVPTHLRTMDQKLTHQRRQEIAALVRQIPDILVTAADLDRLCRPTEAIPAIPSLEKPCSIGLVCREDGCVFVRTHRATIFRHYRTNHSWKNPWVKGGDIRHQAQSHSQPWRTNVRCQRLFKGGSGSFWFEVLGSPSSPSSAALFKARTAKAIAEGSNYEPSPWLERTGWVTHLQGLNYQKLQSAAVSLEPGDGWEGTDQRTMLQEVRASLDRIFQAARRTDTFQVAGVSTLFELHRRDHINKARVPFSGRLEPPTKLRYLNVWKRIVGYLFQAIDRKSLRLFVSLLDHELPNSPYESVVLSAVSVLGLGRSDETVTWRRPHEYSSILSATINISRLLVLQQLYEECRRIQNAGTPEEKETVIGLFDSVRPKILRYLTVVSANTSLVADVQWNGELDPLQSLTLELQRTMRQLLLVEGEESESRRRTKQGHLDGQSNWVLDRILGNPALRTEWLQGTDLRPQTVTRYGKLMEQFRTKLLLLMHLTGGQPARSTEILSIRYCNTSYGGPRNIFLWKGLVCFATSYYKGYRFKQRMKIIH
ncbi:hypothetical protein V8C42DRAFT_362775 [Trichoderma barbatum]